ncbi:hypothetical protein R1sor_008110 [Riccia sorocarpa]|uniref:Uncharacterized protein n=1 Tax=Riccia sorocarpa TaxID=122646 RepID=A0ABD3HYQ1_9MARC
MLRLIIQAFRNNRNLKPKVRQGKGSGWQPAKIPSWLRLFKQGKKRCQNCRHLVQELTKRENHKKQMVKYLCPSVLEAFAPAIEAARHGKDSMDGGEGAHILPEAKDRRPVHLSFDWGKKAREKALAVQLSMGVHNRSPGKEKVKVTSQGSDEEKDDKKKRAEQILAQAMEAMEGADDVTQA